MSKEQAPSVSLLGMAAYAAPVAGSYFFYIPMWSILPGIYAKYFGLSLTSLGLAVVVLRLFDGVIDTGIGYLSDRHRAAGGSRKAWVVSGGLSTIVVCYFLFQPPQPTTMTFYLSWSLAYFLAFTVAEIPHMTWGGELTLNYQRRAQVFGMRHLAVNLGGIAFYTLPLTPLFASSQYTPEVIQYAAYVGATMTALGLAWAAWAAPAGIAMPSVREDSWRMFVHSIIRNKPLLVYFAAYGSLGLAGGMWYGLAFFYLDSFLRLGDKVAVIFLAAVVLSTMSIPVWLKLIRLTSKGTAWSVGVLLFTVQLGCAWPIRPGSPLWVPFLMAIVVHVFFACHGVAALSILGDIVDYGKLRFSKDRGATYFGINSLIFKVGLGIGGGAALGIAGFFGFDPSQASHTSGSIFGLKLGFVILPACFAALGLLLIWRLPIDKRRYEIIRRRLESRLKVQNRTSPLEGPSIV